MAIVRVDYSSGQTAAFTSIVSRIIDSTMRELLNVPSHENYIVCQEHKAGDVFHSPETGSHQRINDIVFIQVTLNQGRTAELKLTFLEELATRISNATNISKGNIYINLGSVLNQSNAAMPYEILAE